MPENRTPIFLKYSQDLNPGIVRFSNDQNMSGCRMVQTGSGFEWSNHLCDHLKTLHRNVPFTDASVFGPSVFIFRKNWVLVQFLSPICLASPEIIEDEVVDRQTDKVFDTIYMGVNIFFWG